MHYVLTVLWTWRGHYCNGIKVFFNKSKQPGCKGDLAVTSVTLLIARIQLIWLARWVSPSPSQLHEHPFQSCVLGWGGPSPIQKDHPVVKGIMSSCSSLLGPPTSSWIDATNLKDGPKWSLPPDIYVLVQSPLILYEGCCAWQMEVGRSDMSLLKPDHKRHWGICLILLWIVWGKLAAMLWGHLSSLWRGPHGKEQRSWTKSHVSLGCRWSSLAQPSLRWLPIFWLQSQDTELEPLS